MADFHFIRPYWLLAIFVLIAALYLVKKLQISRSGWSNIIPAHLTNILLNHNANNTQQVKAQKRDSYALLKPFIIGLLTIIALAGPTWKKLPQPVFQIAKGSVLIMDMSYSMYATDLLPNRLTRARYKAIDLLNNLKEGDVGLIAYAGDAFIISPLTEDVNNIKLLLPSLSPDIMPEVGSNPLPALTMADKMLRNAGHAQGDIYWFTDGIDQEDIQDINQWSKDHPHRLNILGIGTSAGAPIKLPNGELLKDNRGAIVIPKLSSGLLLGIAQHGRGVYQTIRNDNKDIETLLAKSASNKQEKKQRKENTQLGDQWQEAGPYLVIIILPLLLSYFRRGTLLALIPISVFLLPTPQAQANIWQDLWKTKDQQAQEKFNQQQYKQAAKNFSDPLWQGSAYYKAGDYEKALKAFEKSGSAEALYNKANALAKLNKLEDAINAYQQALAKNPELTDAKENKKLIEELLKQQQNKQNQEKNNENKQNNKENKEQQNKNAQQQGSQQQSKQEQKQQKQDPQQSENNEPKDKQQSQQQNNAQRNKKQENKNSAQDNKDKNTQEQQQKADTEKQKQEQQAKAQKANNEKNNAQPQQAQAKMTEKEKEMQQKHQQLLNKVTDDPYLLLRNKMQLEYQKRRHNNNRRGVEKSW